MGSNTIETAGEVHFVRYQFHPRMKIGEIHEKKGNDEMAREFYKKALKFASVSQYLDGIDAALKKLTSY